MIISKLMGGTANQLFQWAHGKSISLEYNVDFYIDISFYSNQSGVTKREFRLDKFPNFSEKIFSGINNNKQTYLVNDNFHFNKINIDKNFNYYLDGYWQSEKYFSKYRNEILNILSPDENFIQKSDVGENSLSIHVRRTDYVNQQENHPVQPISYYENAVEIIGGYDKLFIFSDDIEWCKNNFKFDNITYIEGNSDIEDIWLMSLCKNNIIANSSFSWWGAWLNKNEDKKVIAPNMWFGSNLKLNTGDILPEKWIKI